MCKNVCKCVKNGKNILVAYSPSEGHGESPVGNSRMGGGDGGGGRSGPACAAPEPSAPRNKIPPKGRLVNEYRMIRMIGIPEEYGPYMHRYTYSTHLR